MANISKTSKKRGKKVVKKQDKAPDRNFILLKAIQGKKQKNNDGEPQLYKANIQRRDTSVRKFFEISLPTTKKRSDIMPGQLIMFDYLTPKTKEQLEYYDAMPCTIFFGEFSTKEGPRVIGFNLHYYPPKFRYRIIDRIFEIFKPLYLKSWGDPITESMEMNYSMILKQLQKEKLDFGVRMYIPKLMKRITPIPPKFWQKAVFTEGRFKKQTREAILNYWKQKK